MENQMASTPAPQPTSTQQDAQQNNPIQRKLNKILESRIENEKVFQNSWII
jgi:hypothetical protein